MAFVSKKKSGLSFEQYVIFAIAQEGTAKVRWIRSQEFAALLNKKKVEIFREVEKVTEAVDKGTLLEVLDAATE